MLNGLSQSLSLQVGYDIYSEEDLLALDSAPESVAVAVAPPPGFLAQVPGTWYLVPDTYVPGTWYLIPVAFFELFLQLEREQGAGVGEAVGVGGGKKKGKKSGGY